MARDPRYDILFEPVNVGPLTLRNRFYATPQCTGSGHQYINVQNAHREVRAEGGWAAVCTDVCSIHPTSELGPLAYLKLWDDHDVQALSAMTEAVHRHGAVAGCELAHFGGTSPNLVSREVPMGPSCRPHRDMPSHTRAMDKSDIRALRQWNREAVKRAKQAGFDIIYVYSAHNLSVVTEFLSIRTNHRTDEYGGSLENRARLLREFIEDTKETAGDTCAIAVRMQVDELLGAAGIRADHEARDLLEMLGELPDLWDVNLSDVHNDIPTSRFTSEAYQEPYVKFVKKVTSKPVVGVGWFTSPDTMVSQIKRGILDLVGAARAGIADPFLPNKIGEGREDDIRECIGCNICLSGEYLIAPMRCTQNPTVSEEWRRDWHPEIIAPKIADEKVLIVGAGPAGLECARAMGQRGYQVALAEAKRELGGRLNRESRFTGMAPYARVRDWRVSQILKMPNVETFPESELSAEDILDLGYQHVVLATGAAWSASGISRLNFAPVENDGSVAVITPDEVMDDIDVLGPVLVFDDDRYYIGSAVAQRMRERGLEVALLTPDPQAAQWSNNTVEAKAWNKKLRSMGVDIVTEKNLLAVRDGGAECGCVYTGATTHIKVATIVMVAARQPHDALHQELVSDPTRLKNANIVSVSQIGDCLAPGIIAEAVYAGHRFAREFGAVAKEQIGALNERVVIYKPDGSTHAKIWQKENSE